MTTDAKVIVTTLTTGTAIDNVAVTTSQGSVNRQRVTVADLVTEVDASQTISTGAVSLVPAGAVSNWLKIQNCSQNGQVLGYTTDGSTPVIGNPGTFLLLPYGFDKFESRLPTAAVQGIGSAASTIATVKYA